MTAKPNIRDMSLEEIEALIASLGKERYRALQIMKWLYTGGATSFAEMTTLARDFRTRMEDLTRIAEPAIDRIQTSQDGTKKVLFRIEGDLFIESVLIPGRNHWTACISTQAGCAMGCVFCATGQMGFGRHLTSGEIVEQVLYYARQLKQRGERVTNVVIMGMGEPFHNYDNTMAAIDLLNDPQWFKLGERRFTISTVGLIPAIRRFAAEKRQVNLAISLHAPNDERRTALLPINKKYPISDLIAACKEYTEQTGRRLTFEWALIQDVNETLDDARELGHLLKGMLCHVNVIPLNPTRKYAGKATTRERAEIFKAELERFGIPCTIRIRRGIDIQAGCGQLATEARSANR
jgi:23S rRNA (adenine2503-C2)-methyltransferase